MPWIESTDDSYPSYYKINTTASAYNYNEKDIEFAKNKRKVVSLDREFFLNLQKDFAKVKQYSDAKWASNEASKLLKQFRGWDWAIKWIEGDYDWRTSKASKEIAPYIDDAFDTIVYSFNIDLLTSV